LVGALMGTTESTQADASKTGMASFEVAFQALLHERPGIVASESGGELEWLKTVRDRDALRWRTEGLPTRRLERWKYTNVAPLAKEKILLQSELAPSALPERTSLPALAGEFAAEVVFLNGHFIKQWSKLDIEKGVSLVVLSELFDECVNNGWSSERLEKFSSFREHLETSDADRETVFAALNTSFMQDGVLIYVEPQTKLSKPILITYLQSSSAAPGSLPMISPRVFAHLDRLSEASIVEHYAGAGPGAYMTNAVSDLRLEQGARLSFAKIQAESETGTHLGTTRVHQKADSWSECFQFSFGGRLSRQDLHVTLEGKGAETTLDGLYMARHKQHVDNFTSIDHAVANTTSQQLYKGILSDEARAAFNGRIHIHRDAQQSNAAQLSRCLLLSRKAEADTKPELEIYADDVKASHGATVGQIDPEHVFYLEARAISRVDAMRMLARGYAQEVVFRIQNTAIRGLLQGFVDQRFDLLIPKSVDLSTIGASDV
jgi:Fe-S cluster assembly protein SufD